MTSFPLTRLTLVKDGVKWRIKKYSPMSLLLLFLFFLLSFFSVQTRLVVMIRSKNYEKDLRSDQFEDSTVKEKYSRDTKFFSVKTLLKTLHLSGRL